MWELAPDQNCDTYLLFICLFINEYDTNTFIKLLHRSYV